MRVTSLPLSASLLTGGLVLILGGQAQAQPTLKVEQVTGRAEVQSVGGAWQGLPAGSTVTTGVRTGTGRVILSANQSRVTVGSASRLRVYQGEPDFQVGQSLFEGEGGFFALGWHINTEPRGRVRIDLPPNVNAPRLAVLQGRLRLSQGSRKINLQAGQQINLSTAVITNFTETDPWYAAQFVGEGRATIEALRGEVRHRAGGTVRDAARGSVLATGDNVTTGASSWVEIGFVGGGYLRLTEQSELSVVSVDKTASGREVTLRLLRGSVWNVVQKGQGGYRITTPVVSTAVRGTHFRVDADGTVKVMEGSVSLPSEPGISLSAGQQKAAGQAVTPLQLDELDRMNTELDAQRARPLTLQARWAGVGGPYTIFQKELGLSVQSESNADVALQLAGPQGEHQVTLREVGENGRYELPTNVPTFPEGEYVATLSARRYGQTLTQKFRLELDRTPAQVSDLQVSGQGRVLQVTGRLQENLSGPTRVNFTFSDGQTVTRWLSSGEFRVLRPAGATLTQITTRDRSGNEVHVRP